jgi:hypothetical protein
MEQKCKTLTHASAIVLRQTSERKISSPSKSSALQMPRRLLVVSSSQQFTTRLNIVRRSFLFKHHYFPPILGNNRRSKIVPFVRNDEDGEEEMSRLNLGDEHGRRLIDRLLQFVHEQGIQMKRRVLQCISIPIETVDTQREYHLRAMSWLSCIIDSGYSSGTVFGRRIQIQLMHASKRPAYWVLPTWS